MQLQVDDDADVSQWGVGGWGEVGIDMPSNPRAWQITTE